MAEQWTAQEKVASSVDDTEHLFALLLPSLVFSHARS